MSIPKDMMSFKEFKQAGNLSEPIFFPRDPSAVHPVLKEKVRIIIRYLVLEMQEWHHTERCVSKISTETVHIVDGIKAVLISHDEPFTKEGVDKNYQDLATFIEVEVLDNNTELPYSLGSFLGLLRNQSRDEDDIDLIRLHYGVLDTSNRVQMISQAYHASGCLEKSDQTLFDDVVKKVPDCKKWGHKIKQKGILPAVTTTGGSYNKKKRPTDSQELLAYHRNFVDHAGVTKIPKFKTTDMEFYNWRHRSSSDQVEEMDAMESNVYTTVKEEPNHTFEEAVNVLESCFPRFMTDLQIGLHSNKLLKFIGLDSSDPYS